jgi:hypothetical protein
MRKKRSTAGSLRWFDTGEAERLRRNFDGQDAVDDTRAQTVAAPVNPSKEVGEPDRCETTWYRLVTALASTYVYVLVHTAPEPCRFEIDRRGRARCYLSNDLQWELELPPAAYDQIELVADLWREGVVDSCLQVSSLRLGAPETPASGVRSVTIMPAFDPNRRTQTVALDAHKR